MFGMFGVFGGFSQLCSLEGILSSQNFMSISRFLSEYVLVLMVLVMFAAALRSRTVPRAAERFAAHLLQQQRYFARHRGGELRARGKFSGLQEDFRHVSMSEKKKRRVEVVDYQPQVDEEPLVPDDQLRSGLVIERFGQRLLVEFTDKRNDSVGQRVLCLQRGKFIDKEPIVCGDSVRFSFPITNITASTNSSSECGAPEPPMGMVQELVERRNVLQRPSAGSKRNKIVLRPIAANIDQLFIVVATEPLVPLHTIDQFIVSAVHNDIPAVHLVINKADLSETQELHEMLSFYEELGHKVILASAHEPGRLKKLRDLMRGKTSVFVGQSGVGKSSLVNALLPKVDARVGDLVANNLYGAHTTSNAHLYYIDEDDHDQGAIVDSPGIRELGIWHLDRRDVQDGFVEIARAAEDCKFRNCAHEEKDRRFCAVWAAVEEQRIHPLRYRSFIALRNQHHD